MRSLKTSRSRRRPSGALHHAKQAAFTRELRATGGSQRPYEWNQWDSQGSTPLFRRIARGQIPASSFPRMRHGLCIRPSKGRLPENEGLPGDPTGPVSGINGIARGRPPLSEKFRGLARSAAHSRYPSGQRNSGNALTHPEPLNRPLRTCWHTWRCPPPASVRPW